jgi:hypothetical protein
VKYPQPVALKVRIRFLAIGVVAGVSLTGIRVIFASIPRVIFQEHDQEDPSDLGSSNFAPIRPPIILRHVEVNEGAAPNTFEMELDRLGLVTLIGKCVRE